MARPRSFDRNQVLAAVERQFRRTGYSGTSLDDIAAVTRLGRGSLYAAFGDKHRLFLLTLGEYCDRKAAEAESMLTGSDESALQRLHAYLTGNARFAFDDLDGLGCMAGKFALEVGSSDPEAAELIGACFTRQRAAIEECLESARRHGDLDPASNPAELAAMLLALVRGIDVMAGARMAGKPMTAAVRQALAGLPATRRGRRVVQQVLDGGAA
ncbi:TetR/AcrR family transcriptional regulator [Nocardia sp. NPDC050799]|uniref:TetR/AcrR family transcriptional regulator n=1 Tax=Nocardia sp. NPDC050799 TaxID=3154842 RepID=UPI00340D764E